MNTEALFADGGCRYVIPAEPKPGEKVKLRFRTAKNDVDKVCLITEMGDHPMQKEESDGKGFDYYAIDWQLGNQSFSYYFQITAKGECCYYNRYGVGREGAECYSFRIFPGFSTPAWAKGAVFYQILVERFCNGDPSNDVETGEYLYLGKPCRKVEDWKQPPSQDGYREFYGGDLKGVLDKLDYLQDLGIEAVYFNPLFVSPSSHKYDTQDYEHIDPHYGVIPVDGGRVLRQGEEDNSVASKYEQRTTGDLNLKESDELFVHLVKEMHKRGMRVILDGVFNHCGSFHKWFDQEGFYRGEDKGQAGAYRSEKSPFRAYFHFLDENDRESYETWWNQSNLPKLFYGNSPELMQYMLEIGRKWVGAPFFADGWRLDVAADLGVSSEENHSFWKQFRQVVKEENPEALLLAEHYGDPSPWLNGQEWDSVMNYDAFLEPVSWFLTGMEKHGDWSCRELLGNGEAFVETMLVHMAKMPIPSLEVAMNELSNHDHSRFLTRTNHMVGRMEERKAVAAENNVQEAVMRQAVVLQLTWIGAPTIYYGDEAGQVGFTDPDSRRTYPWGQENHELLLFYQELIRLHKAYYALKRGSLLILSWGEQMLSYGRFTDQEQFVVVLHLGEEKTVLTVPVWRAEVPENGEMIRLVYTYDIGYTMEPVCYPVEGGMLRVELEAASAMVLYASGR